MVFCITFPVPAMRGDGGGLSALRADVERFSSGLRNEACGKNRGEKDERSLGTSAVPCKTRLCPAKLGCAL